MALSFPYALAALSDRLRIGDVTFDVLRNDEMSGGGDGRYWSAELAPPLWQVRMGLTPYKLDYAREIDAKIRALGVGKQSFLFADPKYAPAAGAAPTSGVTIGSVSADRTQISLSGLPVDYVLSVGDRFSVNWGTGRVFFGEFSESRTATGLGNTGLGAIFPYLPFGISGGASVELAVPALKVIIPPGGHVPFTTGVDRIARSGALTLLQKV
jgi:hypothetical protein